MLALIPATARPCAGCRDALDQGHPGQIVQGTLRALAGEPLLAAYRGFLLRGLTPERTGVNRCSDSEPAHVFTSRPRIASSAEALLVGQGNVHMHFLPRFKSQGGNWQLWAINGR